MKLGPQFEQRVVRELPSLHGIPCIMINVSCEQNARAWYSSVLGIDFDERPHVGGVNLAFTETASPAPSRHPILTFATPDLAQAHRALLVAGATPGPIDCATRSFTFRDPDGNLLTFIQSS